VYGLKQYFKAFWNDQSGISSVEYVLLLSFFFSSIVVAAETLSNAMVSEIGATLWQPLGPF